MRLLVLALLSLTTLAMAQPTAAERLALVQRAPEASQVSGVLTQARRALQRADELERAGQPQAAVRARGIADAALTLAERKIARARAHAALRQAIGERDEALRRRDVARQALETARGTE